MFIALIYSSKLFITSYYVPSNYLLYFYSLTIGNIQLSLKHKRKASFLQCIIIQMVDILYSKCIQTVIITVSFYLLFNFFLCFTWDDWRIHSKSFINKHAAFTAWDTTIFTFYLNFKEKDRGNVRAELWRN